MIYEEKCPTIHSPHLTASSKDLSLFISSIMRGCFTRLAICLFNSLYSKSSASPFDFAPFSDFSVEGPFTVLTHLVQYPVISSSTRYKSFSHDAHFQPIVFS